MRDHPGAEPAVGDVDGVVRPVVDGDIDGDRREFDDLDPAAPGWCPDCR
ncbi:hypothetical protein ABT023_09655 [Micromonospora sp. NPDC002296]